MLNLIKYEFRKTWTTKLILLGATVAAQIVFLIGLYADKETPLSIGMMLLVMLAFGGILVIGLESIVTLHRDMNTKQSYMLFMTPNSSYRILGAKMLENGLSILLGGLFYFLLGMLDITLLLAKLGELNELWNMIRDIIEAFNSEIRLDLSGIGSFFFAMLCGWVGVVTMAFLADVVSSALLNGKKHNGLVSFLFFLLLSWLTGWASRAITDNISFINTQLVMQGVISLVFACIMYFAAAQIMERKLSV